MPWAAWRSTVRIAPGLSPSSWRVSEAGTPWRLSLRPTGGRPLHPSWRKWGSQPSTTCGSRRTRSFGGSPKGGPLRCVSARQCRRLLSSTVHSGGRRYLGSPAAISAASGGCGRTPTWDTLRRVTHTGDGGRCWWSRRLSRSTACPGRHHRFPLPVRTPPRQSVGVSPGTPSVTVGLGVARTRGAADASRAGTGPAVSVGSGAIRTPRLVEEIAPMRTAIGTAGGAAPPPAGTRGVSVRGTRAAAGRASAAAIVAALEAA